jgi:hypothetical protein
MAWQMPISRGLRKRVSRLLEYVNDSFPLVTPARDLSDYVVEFSGLECLGNLSLWDLLEDNDELR